MQNWARLCRRGRTCPNRARGSGEVADAATVEIANAAAAKIADAAAAKVADAAAAKVGNATATVIGNAVAADIVNAGAGVGDTAATGIGNAAAARVVDARAAGIAYTRAAGVLHAGACAGNAVAGADGPGGQRGAAGYGVVGSLAGVLGAAGGGLRSEDVHEADGDGIAGREGIELDLLPEAMAR